MKKLLSLAVLSACIGISAREMPIYNGRLEGALNANQCNITNLPDAFWEGHGGSVDTNSVQSIIQRNIDTNYLCTVEAAQAMTNGAVSVATNSAVAYADATFRTRTDNVCHTNTTRWTPAISADGNFTFFTTQPHYSEGDTEQESSFVWVSDQGTASGMGFFESEEGVSESATQLTFHQILGGSNSFNSRLVSIATSGHPFVTADNVPSTNGLISAEAATNAAEAVFGSKGPSDIGAYPNTSGQQLAAQVSTQGAHLNAEDAQFVSTNYDSQVNLPEAYVRIKLQQGGTNVWRTIWEEMRRWNKFCGGGFDWQTWDGFHAWSTNIQAMIEETSPKEYAFFDGVTGDVAPDGFFWISQPRIGICADASYQRHLDSGNAVWILESNGLTSNVGGTTNGYFRISDEEGNTQFEIIKGDKQTVPAVARSIRSESVLGVTHWFCDYSVTNAVAAPVAKFCRNLGANNPVWYDDTDASCPCNVTWTPGVNSYTLEFWPKSAEPMMFCKSEYDRGGETKIRQAVPTEMQYIILNGTKYGLVPKTVNGELVMGLTTGN